MLVWFVIVPITFTSMYMRSFSIDPKKAFYLRNSAVDFLYCLTYRSDIIFYFAPNCFNVVVDRIRTDALRLSTLFNSHSFYVHLLLLHDFSVSFGENGAVDGACVLPRVLILHNHQSAK